MLDAELTLKKLKKYIPKTEKIGREYKANCPFCSQNNFYINLCFDGRFNCFSCGYQKANIDFLIQDIETKSYTYLKEKNDEFENYLKIYKAQKELRKFTRLNKAEFKITKNYL